jgi:hypothetical protein
MSISVMSNPALKARRIEEAWAAYEGALRPSLKIGLNGEDDNVPSGLGRMVVDSLTAWTLGKEVGITTDEVIGSNPAETLIDDVWPMDRRMVQLQRARTEGGVTGSAFLRVLPNRVIVLPSENVAMLINPLDNDQVDAYVIDFEVPETDNSGRSLRYRQSHLRLPDGGWLIRDEQEQRNGKFAVIGETPWPYELPQIVHCSNTQSSFAWGMPDLEDDVIATIRQIQRVLSNSVRMIRLSAHPIEYTRGLVDSNSRAAYEGRPSGAVVHLVDETQEIGLSETTGKGPEQALNLHRELKRQLHAVTGLPDFADPDTAAQISGASGRALELRLAPLIQRVELLRRNYGQLIAGAAERILAFNGVADQSPRPDWQPILPADPMGEVERAQMLMEIGASNQTVLEAAGLDADAELQRLAAEGNQMAAQAAAMDGAQGSAEELTDAERVRQLRAQIEEAGMRLVEQGGQITAVDEPNSNPGA